GRLEDRLRRPQIANTWVRRWLAWQTPELTKLQPSPPRKRRMSARKLLSLFDFRGNPGSSEKPLPVHCGNGLVAISCSRTTSRLPARRYRKQPSAPGSSTWNKPSQNRATASATIPSVLQCMHHISN